MSYPIIVSFRHIKHSAHLEKLIRLRALQLSHGCREILQCRVTVEIPHKHHESGNGFAVKIHVSVPGKEILVVKQTEHSEPNSTVRETVRDAFDAVRRQLLDYAEARQLRNEKPVVRTGA